MTGHELIDRVLHYYPQFSRQDGERIVKELFQSLSAALIQGERIELRGFGVFGVKAVPARQRRNPRTGAPVLLAAQRRPYFKAAKEMHVRLNGVEATETSALRSS